MSEEVIQAAIQAITEELERTPENAILYKERGRLWQMLGNAQQAMDDMRQAIRIDPSVVDDLRNGSFQGDIKGCH